MMVTRAAIHVFPLSYFDSFVSQAGYDGGGYIADRNRIVGGMLVRNSEDRYSPCRVLQFTVVYCTKE